MGKIAQQVRNPPDILKKSSVMVCTKTVGTLENRQIIRGFSVYTGRIKVLTADLLSVQSWCISSENPCSRKNPPNNYILFRGSIFGPKSYEVIWKQEEKHMVWLLSYDLMRKFYMADAFLRNSYGFYSYWNRKNLPIFYMTSQVIYFLNVNKVEI